MNARMHQAQGQPGVQGAPETVPWMTVPFFSSICTVSLDSFIRNLRHATGKHIQEAHKWVHEQSCVVCTNVRCSCALDAAL